MEFDNLFEHKISISCNRFIDGDGDEVEDNYVGELVGIGDKFVVIKDMTDGASRANPSEVFVPIAQIRDMKHFHNRCPVCDPNYEDKRPTSYDPNWRFTSDR